MTGVNCSNEHFLPSAGKRRKEDTAIWNNKVILPVFCIIDNLEKIIEIG